MALLFHGLALVLVVIVGRLYYLGVEESFFWIYPWYDMLLHTLGGLTAGLWASAVAQHWRMRTWLGFSFVLCVALAAALLWEGFEYVTDLQGSVADTLSDIVLGAFGAVLAWLLLIMCRVCRRELTPHNQ